MWCIIFTSKVKLGKSMEVGRYSWNKKHHHASLGCPIFNLCFSRHYRHSWIQSIRTVKQTIQAFIREKKNRQKNVLLLNVSFSVKWQAVRLKGFQINLASYCQNLTLKGQSEIKWEFSPCSLCIEKRSFVSICFAILFSLQSSIQILIIAFHQWSQWPLHACVECVFVYLYVYLCLCVWIYNCVFMVGMCAFVYICICIPLCVSLSMFVFIVCYYNFSIFIDGRTVIFYLCFNK